MEPVDRVRVLVVGDAGTGKSTLVHQLCQQVPPPRPPPRTVGFALDVAIVEVAAQSKHSATRGALYHGANALLLVHDLSNRNSYANLWRWYDEVVYGVAATTTTAGDHLVMPQLANSSGGGTGSGFSRSPSTDAMRVTRTTPPQTRRYAAGGGNATIGNALTTGFHRSVSATSESGGGLGGLGSTGFRSTSGSGGINSPEDITLRVIGNGTTTANTLTTSGTPALLPLLVVGTKRDRMTGMRASCEIAQEFGGQWADLNCMQPLPASIDGSAVIDAFLDRVIDAKFFPSMAGR